MKFKIIEKSAMRLVGFTKKFSVKSHEHQEEIPKLWDESFKNGNAQKIFGLADHNSFGCLGVCSCPDDKTLEYSIAIATDKDAPEGFDEIFVSPCNWAVFETEGEMPKSIQDAFSYIYGVWFTNCGYEHDMAPDLEVYIQGSNENDMKSEVWIPVKKC